MTVVIIARSMGVSRAETRLRTVMESQTEQRSFAGRLTSLALQAREYRGRWCHDRLWSPVSILWILQSSE